MQKQLSKSAAVVAKTMYAAMKILKDNEGQMGYSQLRKTIADTISFTDWEQSFSSEKTKKSGQPRWEVNMNYYSIDYSKAGFITKDNGVWYLTADGEKMLEQSPESVFAAAHTAYRIWAKENGQHETIDEDTEDIAEPTTQMIISEMESKASDGIRAYVRRMNAYEFQDFVAALLRGMGLYTPFIAPKGKDGGIDVMAYENPMGVGNRVIVQVKHMPTSAISRDVVSSLSAMLRKDSDTGIIISSGTFSGEALRFAREQTRNIRLIDGEEVMRLWKQYYERLSEEDRAFLPLHPVYFLG